MITKWRWWLGGGLGLGLALFVLITLFPAAGATLADPVRRVIGNRGVAQIEMLVFQVQDTLRQWSYQTGLVEVETPWQLPPTPANTPTAAPSATPTTRPVQEKNTPIVVTPTVTPTPTITPTPSPTPWTLPPLTPLGNLAGEGQWSPYLAVDGEPVAIRTFLQPDAADRPFAVAAIVAIDLRHTQLHFILGSEEPSLADGPRGYGFMDKAHKQAGLLLATFNGGFKATHGRFGAQDAWTEAIPPREGYGTVVMYEDGSVRLGEWGVDELPAEGIIALRQNARLVVQDGAITEEVYNNSVADWGGTIDFDIVTWRSGIGLSADGQTLYFVAGPSLSMPALAQTMVSAGVDNGILLDINESWVMFSAIQADEAGNLTAAPLLPEGMSHQPDRYLRQSPRDFFYVTVKQE